MSGPSKFLPFCSVTASFRWLQILTVYSVNYRWESEECNLDAIETIEKTHKKFSFPEAHGKNIFYGTSIYWN